MDKRHQLAKIKIEEIMDLVVATPTTIKADADIDDVIIKINDDLKTRHVYVVDDENRLIGSVRMNTIVQYLFPLGAIFTAGITTYNNLNVNIFSKKVSDVMKKDPFYVKPNAQLSEIASIMINEKINELPVVDDDMKIVGQINVYEIIEAFKKL